ncbi:multicopper oxidase domain-containing protein [Terrabacter sp. 2RAF25]|uniref:multicopper oxidase domain-containing protein n=1 Tax=Terrabacter sp. 2RAF25 TaxID=3232998 RepID=UPI003F95ACC9
MSRGEQQTSTPPAQRPVVADLPGRGAWALRDHPTTLWLSAALVVAAFGRGLPAADWLVIHLVLLGAVTHAVMVWSTHFAQALLKTPPGLDDRRQQGRRLALLLLGSSLVLVGVPAALWPVTLVGAACAAASVTWHGIALWRRLRSALPGRFRVTIRYYLAATACMPVGATFGVLLARHPADPWHSRLMVAHSVTMALGWLGLVVTGTLVTLWPTMLRARMDERAETLARQALPGLLAGLVTAVGGALADLRALAVIGLLAYAAGLAWWARALIAPARRSVPRRFATVSAACALSWFLASVITVAALLALQPDWTSIGGRYESVAVALAVGFALQLVLAALSHLVPSVLGGGPSAVRAGLARFEGGAPTRVVGHNLGLLLFLLPLPDATRAAAAVVVGLCVAAFLPLTVLAVLASVRARKAAGAAIPGAPTMRISKQERPFWFSPQVPAAISCLALVAVVSIGLGGAAAGGGPADAVVSTGHTTTVHVVAEGMHFTPSSVDVPRGDRLVIRLSNADRTTAHDLVLADGTRTPRLAPGATAALEVAVVRESMDGWCSVVGHRQMGMVLHIRTAGAPGATADTGAGTPPAATGTMHADHEGLSAAPTPFDPALPPLTAGRTHQVTLTVGEAEQEVAPGRWQRRWTFNGASPGPTLHGRVGDVFEVTLVNHATIGHSIDFHAGSRAPDEVMRTVPPGASLTYRFTATRAGIWLYHCSTMPMSAHLAAGLVGAVVIEPPELPAVERSYVFVQSEIYLGTNSSKGSADEVDAAKAGADTPDLVAFNGVADQYDTSPLPAQVGQRVRFWVLDAGPNRATSFHVVGAQFDTAYAEGAWLLRPGASRGGSQSLSLGPGQGGFVETVFDEPGHYPFVSHVMADAERGAHGIVQVRP